MCVCVCVCVKLFLGNLNPGPCLPHPTSIYTCGVTTHQGCAVVTFYFL